MLVRECGRSREMFETSGLVIEADNQSVVLFASVPLTDEAWQPLHEGKLVVIQDGLAGRRMSWERPTLQPNNPAL
jgi:predicted glutamine amidotransferase